MSDLLLSNDEIAAVTGYTRQADQQAWFEKNNIPCYINRNGLTVARAWFEKAPFEHRSTAPQLPATGAKPNFGAITKKAS